MAEETNAPSRKVTTLADGTDLVAKRMEGASGTAFPEHAASLESVLVVTDGRCIIKFRDTEHGLAPGDSLVVPAGEWHQVVAAPQFAAVHVMPKDIRFTFVS